MTVRLPAVGPIAAAFLCLGLVGGVAYVVVPHSPWSEMVLFNGSVAIAVGVALSGVRRSRGTARRIAAFTSLALACFLVGEVIWWWASIANRDPFPSLADVSYLGGYVPLAIAAVLLAGQRRKEPDQLAVLDAAILTLSAGTIIYLVLIEPYASDQGLPFLDKAILIAYPMADLFVLGTVLWLLVAHAARDWVSVLFGAGLVFTLVGDFVFSWQELNSEYRDASPVDLLWIAGYLLLAAAVVTRPQTRAPVEARRPGRVRLFAVLLAVLVPVAPVLVSLMNLRGIQLRTAAITLVLLTSMVVLVVIRMWELVGRAHAVEQHRAEKRLSAVIHHSDDSILLVDRQMRIVYASPSVSRLTGADLDAESKVALSSLFVEADRAGLDLRMTELAMMPAGYVIPLEGRIRSPLATHRVVEGSACNLLDDETVAACVVTLRDVTVRHSLEDQLRRKSLYDDLTGLANRGLFKDRLRHTLGKFDERPETGVAVLFIDVDDFKLVNDALGRPAGDELLKQCARRLRAFENWAEVIARLGGDEFGIVLEGVVSRSSVVEFASRVRDVLRVPMTLQGIPVRGAVSIGVALSDPGCSVESLLRNADLAAHSAKAQGGGRVVLSAEGLREAAGDRLALKTSLAEALGTEQMRVAYQPIHEAGGDRCLKGFEALLRWDHPTRGPVPPETFIPVAEASGDIVAIGRWVLEEACAQAAGWNATRRVPLTMHVNASALELASTGFTRGVRSILASTRFPPGLLTIELTESVMAEAQMIEGVLVELRRIGVGIAVDDFGTGFSSLSYLQRFPVTALKIDQSFVSEMSSGSDNRLVRSIIATAEALDAKSVAEGVETLEQLNELDRLGCDFVQGYYFGRPQAAKELEVAVARSCPPRS